MDPLTHGLLGVAVAVAVAPKEHRRAAAVVGFLAGEFPDLDVFLRSKDDPLFGLAMHRHFTHSLLMVPVIGMTMAWLVARVHRWRGGDSSVKALAGAGMLAAFSHAFCDVWTSYGTRWFWPFSDQRVSWDWISVIDPLFTLPLLPLVVIGVMRRSRVWMFRAMIWAVFYLSLCVVQKHRVMDAARAVAAERGDAYERLTVKPSFGNIVVWRALYEVEGRAEVMSFRAGKEVSLLGQSRASLVRLADLPQINGDSVLGRDIRRFAHFSDDWLAWHPEHPGVLGDLRYALRPDVVSPLWGIKVDPRVPDRHVAFLSFRSTRDEGWEELWAMIVKED
jgi:inner membrane protein